MTTGQLHSIPTHALYQPGTAELRDWLHRRGLRMSLLELTQERRRRTSPDRPLGEETT
jgi:hypothetical protein